MRKSKVFDAVAVVSRHLYKLGVRRCGHFPSRTAHAPVSRRCASHRARRHGLPIAVHPSIIIFFILFILMDERRMAWPVAGGGTGVGQFGQDGIQAPAGNVSGDNGDIAPGLVRAGSAWRYFECRSRRAAPPASRPCRRRWLPMTASRVARSQSPSRCWGRRRRPPSCCNSVIKTLLKEMLCLTTMLMTTSGNEMVLQAKYSTRYADHDVGVSALPVS